MRRTSRARRAATREDFPRYLQMVDTHYGGDVSRIVLGGVGPLPGDTLLDKARFLEERADGLRRLLIYPPHGNPTMCVDLVVPPVHPEADAGFIIMEVMGYPPFSGSNTVCTATALVESGHLTMRDGVRELLLEAPAGLVPVHAEVRGGRVVAVTVEADPPWVAARDRRVVLPDGREVRFELVWSGCFYLVVEAATLGLALVHGEMARVAEVAAQLVEAATGQLDLWHPTIGDAGPLAFVHLTGPVERVTKGHYRSRSVTYVHPAAEPGAREPFVPGVVCSCPTGTGTAARIALLADDGRFDVGDVLETVAPNGSAFTGTLIGSTPMSEREACRVNLRGRAWTTARSELVVDVTDPLIVDRGLSDVLEVFPFLGR